MEESRVYALGIDASTQSLTGTIINAETGAIAVTARISYRDDDRVNGMGFERDSFLIPPREAGEAEQPPRLFPAALDALFADFKKLNAPLAGLASVNVSGQQHGHVYLSAEARGGLRLQ